MFQALFNNLSEKEKNDAIETMIQHASPRQDFFLMMMLAVAMATFGVILNSVVILIGSMLIAPLLYPLLSLSLGIIAADQKLMSQSIFTLFKSSGLALIAATIIAFLFAPRGAGLIIPLNITAGSASSLMYAVVAAIAGFAAAFASTKAYLNSTLPGVAIAVALVPPLATAGVGLALWNWTIVSNELLLFVVNIIGILFSAMIVFALMRFSVKRRVTQEAVKEEEKIIAKESAPVHTVSETTTKA
jgi:uncharacterized hydrophobic protein (TIGR00271 family)